MAKYRVKQQSFINDMIVEEGEIIDYTPPPGTTISGNLEALEESQSDAVDDADVKYHAFSRDDLKAELGKRGISFASNAPDQKLRVLLELDDAK